MRDALKKFIAVVDAVNDGVGAALAWCLPAMTGITLLIILLGSVFRLGYVWMSELVVYLHAVLFTIAAAHTLSHDEHVRIDVFYARLSPRRRDWINLLGVFVLLIPVCVVILTYSFPYVAAAWRVRETSAEGQGLPAVFLLKTCILVMPLLLILQGLSLAAKCWLRLREK